MRNRLFLALCLVVMTACTDADKFDVNTFFYEPDAQKALIQELAKANIAHRVDHQNVIWYRSQDSERVADLKIKIIQEVLVSQYATSFSRRDDEKLFTDALQKNGIKYQIKEQSGYRWVVWSQADDPRVKNIEKTIGDLLLKRVIDQRRQGKAPK